MCSSDLTQTKNRRPHFDLRDWRKLTRYLREFIKIEHKPVRRDRTLLANYVLILANTGIRVGEARNLVDFHRDLTRDFH